MKIALASVAKGANGTALPPTTVAFESGRATFARAETQQRPTVLGLIASGRMRPDAGEITVDGHTDYSAIRKRIALIDAPDVCEPADEVTVAGVTAEELMFAGRRSHPIAVLRQLRSLGLVEYVRRSIGTMPPTARIRLLCELALLRKGIEGFVLVSPDRHGGDPNEWWQIAHELAERGLAILVVAGDASAAAIAASSLVDRMQSTKQTAEGEQTVDQTVGADAIAEHSAETAADANEADTTDDADDTDDTEPAACPVEAEPTVANSANADAALAGAEPADAKPGDDGIADDRYRDETTEQEDDTAASSATARSATTEINEMGPRPEEDAEHPSEGDEDDS